MQALRVHHFDQGLRLDDLPTPEPAPGEARVRDVFFNVYFPFF